PRPDRGEGALGRPPDDRLPAPGTLCARRRGGHLSAGGHHGRADRRSARLRSARAAPAGAGEGGTMKATQLLHDAGQSLWLDNITRALLESGGLRRYIDELSVTGLTSNPTIFDHAIKNSHDYDAAIREKTAAGISGEGLFFKIPGTREGVPAIEEAIFAGVPVNVTRRARRSSGPAEP